jgi:hypothetical protein
VTEVASEKELIVELARGTSGDAAESGELLVAAASAAFGNVGWDGCRGSLDDDHDEE